MVAFAAVFLASRLPNLRALPVFLDEAIHVEWALKVAQTGRLLGITDGSRYLPIWLLALVVPWAEDPVAAARAGAAVFGLLAALGLVWLGRELYGDGSGWLAALLYLLLPAAVFQDRLALVDSMLGALVVSGLAASRRWARTGSVRWATVAGLLVGAAATTKLYGILLVAAPVLCYALAPGVPRRRLRELSSWMVLVALAAMVPVFLDVGSSARFLSDSIWVFRSGPSGEASPAAELFRALTWSAVQLTPLGCALLAISAWSARRERATWILVGLSAVWITAIVLAAGRDWFPRYLLPALVPLLLLPARLARHAGQALPAWPPRAGAAPALLGLVAAAAWGGADWAVLTDPIRAPLAALDRWQYITGWPSGYGLEEAAERLRRGAEPAGLVVVRDRSSGPLSEGLNVLLRGPTGLSFVDVELRRDAMAPAVGRLLADPRPVWVALEQPVSLRLLLTLDGRSPAPLVARVEKPDRLRAVEIHCVREPCPGPPPRQVPPIGPAPWTAVAIDEPGSLEEARVCLFKRGAHSAAACRRALLRGLTWPLAAEVHFNLGEIQMSLGQIEEAVNSYRAAVEILPDDLEQSLASAEGLVLLGRHEDALGVLDTILARWPGSAPAHSRLGLTLTRLGRLPEAEASFRRSLSLDRSGAALGDLGVVLWLNGRREEGLAALEDAIRLESDALHPRYNRGVVAAALRR